MLKDARRIVTIRIMVKIPGLSISVPYVANERHDMCRRGWAV